ncbi:hypothetical protein Nepgr_000088 [Nepenthes gracilis]|uniref:Uncharacterized protein n=1 Tax=Nepenthes gracilis TaxID=150966 RepID=A0AAD3RVZ7_NEPGR|nr:hypothetical protein Nepgr_000088 [Nepenthes gracilis]
MYFLVRDDLRPGDPDDPLQFDGLLRCCLVETCLSSLPSSLPRRSDLELVVVIWISLIILESQKGTVDTRLTWEAFVDR